MNDSKKNTKTREAASATASPATETAAMTEASPAEVVDEATAGSAEDDGGVPKGLISLIQRYPKYDPGFDARDSRRNEGRLGPAIYGHLLGFINLPATIPDPQTGELKPWHVMVIELLRPAPVKERGKGPVEDKRFLAPAGTQIVMTVTVALHSIRERFGLDVVATDPDRIYEVYIVPKVSMTRQGLSLWIFEDLRMGNPTQRGPLQTIDPFSELRRAAQLRGAPTQSRFGGAFAPAEPQRGMAQLSPQTQQADPSRSPV